ncbi:hypothetical protein Lal_00013984 [Lupinus albus]|uniref:Putative transcription factor C2H2 family n=1 Tax=Lupinus albus TaxID=3870 RepID=A0A6A5LM72_LUPAL|nr:putative transcription factor C2H2 family [Lupinus albus]KAF1861258.1 hypothetical protein Lal_00013984 [Lupinus albus]
MGFPTGYPDILIPKPFVHILTLLAFIRNQILIFFRYLGFHEFLQQDIVWPDPPPEFQSISALLIQEILPVVKFSDMEEPAAETCAVCLYKFEADEEIRRLTNCCHIFHKGCLDRWMGYDQRTCPMCRTPFIPYDMQSTFNERLWLASGIPEFHSQYPHITSF